MNLQCGLHPADRLHRIFSSADRTTQNKHHECINNLESSP